MKPIKSILIIIAFVFCTQLHAQVTVTYTYDNLQRLTQASYSNGVGIQYSYDALGNRTQETKTSTLSVEEVQPLNSLTVYPNPFQDYLNIQTKDDTLLSVQLFDITGRSIKKEDISGTSYQFNLESLLRAVYILEITAEKRKQTVKIVKK
mgnify:CR=1 FL=1